jgi:Zn-dependent protease
MRSGGYATVAYLGGAPLRLHWSILLVGILLSAMVRRFDPIPLSAYGLVVLIHECGHALLVRRYRLELLSIDVHGFGGLCQYSGYVTPLQRSKIAWGGVLAQGVLLLLTDYGIRVFPSAAYGRFGSALEIFAVMNFAMIVFNLLPVRGLDGVEAWKLFAWSNLKSFLRVLRRADRTQTRWKR